MADIEGQLLRDIVDKTPAQRLRWRQDNIEAVNETQVTRFNSIQDFRSGRKEFPGQIVPRGSLSYYEIYPTLLGPISDNFSTAPDRDKLQRTRGLLFPAMIHDRITSRFETLTDFLPYQKFSGSSGSSRATPAERTIAANHLEHHVNGSYAEAIISACKNLQAELIYSATFPGSYRKSVEDELTALSGEKVSNQNAQIIIAAVGSREIDLVLPTLNASKATREAILTEPRDQKIYDGAQKLIDRVESVYRESSEGYADKPMGDISKFFQKEMQALGISLPHTGDNLGYEMPLVKPTSGPGGP